MSQPQRKFITYQRSVPKDTKVSYQSLISHNNNLHNDKDFNSSYYNIKKQPILSKNNSQIDLKQPKQDYFKNLNQRRKNQGQMGHLKSQLQNLKNQVSKLISKQPVIRTPQKQKIGLRDDKSEKKVSVNYITRGFKQIQDDYFHNNNNNNNNEDFDDNVSMSSVTTEKVLNQPLRRLQHTTTSQNFDQGYYQKLENDLLKTQIRNLKNKYVSKKRQLTEKCQLLQKKNEFLQISLQKSEQALVESRRALQMQITLIKRQISQKTAIKNMQEPQNDNVIEIQGNDTLKEKVKRLYDQLTQKNKQINNLNIQLGDIDAMLERKKFQLKKESEKNLELSKQIQFSKCEQSRLQQYLQGEMSKRKELYKQNEVLKQKNKQLMNQIYTKQQIVTGSQQYENRLTQQLDQYKKRQDQQLQSITRLKQQNRKFKQLTQSDRDQISYLKKNLEQSTLRITQINKKLKQQQQKCLQKQDFYRKIIEQTKRKQQQRFKILSQQYQQTHTQLNKQSLKNIQTQNIQIHDILRQKDRQINKWKAEYKILKLKHEQRSNVEKINKQQIQGYYKGFMENKHSKQLLQERNTLLERNVEKYLKIINQKEMEGIKLESGYSKQVEKLKFQVIKLQRDLESQGQELQQTKNSLSESVLRGDHEAKYRQELEIKLARFMYVQVHGNDQQIQEDEQFESVKEFIEQQNQDIEISQGQQQLKQIQSSKKIPRSSKKLINNNSQQIKIYQLSQSQKLQIQNLSQAISSMKKRMIQQDDKTSKTLRELKNKDTQIAKLKKQIRELLQQHQHQLSQLKNKYTSQHIQIQLKTTLASEKQVRQLCSKQVQLYKQKYTTILTQNTEMKRKIVELQKQLLNLRQQTKSLSHLYNVKCLQVEELNEKYSQNMMQKERIIEELQVNKNHRETNLVNQINMLKDEVASLRNQIRNLFSMNKKIQSSSFDEALRNQIQSNKVLREQLSKKNQQVYKLRDNYSMLRSQFDNLRSEIDIQKLKNISQKKKIQIQYQIQAQNLKNRLTVQQKKLLSLQQKISIVIEQNKKKDSFIQSYIMGKKLPQNQKQFVSQFMKQYEIMFNGNLINEKLKADSHELQKMTVYNYNLLKQLAEMKEKMLLYETMDGQNVSVYGSKIDGKSQKSMESQVESPNKGQGKEMMGFSPNTPKVIRIRSKYSMVQSGKS